MLVDVEETEWAGSILAARVGPEGTPSLFMHEPGETDRRYLVRWLTEEELAILTRQLCDMLAAGAAPAIVAATSAARIRERDLPAARSDRDSAR